MWHRRYVCVEGVSKSAVWGRLYDTMAGQKVARMLGREVDEWYTVVGATPLPPDEDTAWGVKAVESSGGNAGPCPSG